MVMLAQRGRVEDIERLQKDGWLFSLKVDGTRAKATVSDGAVALVSRQGVGCTSQYPEVAEALSRALPTGHWVLDGEIAVNDARGLPSWPLTQKRIAQTRNTSAWAGKLPATFHVFDILVADGSDMKHQPYATRWQALVQELGVGNVGATVRPVLHTPNGKRLWEIVTEHHLEGVVAKRPASVYRDARSADWVKIKATSTVSCLVGGIKEGTGGRRSTFGALLLYLLDDTGTLVPVGHVGSGFSDREIVQVMQALHQPPLIVEVEYLDVSPDRQLRQPVFQRIRTDLVATDCTTNQLEGDHA